MPQITMEQAKNAKTQALQTLPAIYVSVGITHKNNEPALAIGVKTQGDAAGIPAEISGVPVVVSVVGEIRAL